MPMSDAWVPRVVYGFLLGIGVLDWVRRYPLLPARMASHFGPHGEVTNRQSKEQFFMTMAVVVGVSFVAGFVVPPLIGIMPASMINLPNKEYWLAPERRKETMRYLGAKMGWFGCALLFLLLFVTSEAIDANMPSHGQFDIGATFAVLFGFVASWEFGRYCCCATSGEFLSSASEVSRIIADVNPCCQDSSCSNKADACL
jgi:uncharacterized membrane protein